MKLTINLPFLPPSVNHAYAVRRGGLYLKSSAKDFVKNVREIVQKEIKKKRFTKIPAGEFFVMEVSFTFENKRFPDPNNMLKILIDSFEDYVFENDKWLLPRVISAKITGKNSTKVVFKPLKNN